MYEAVSGLKFERCSIVAGQCGKEILAPLGRHMQLGVVSKMGERDARAKFEEKSNSYHGQRKYT